MIVIMDMRRHKTTIPNPKLSLCYVNEVEISSSYWKDRFGCSYVESIQL